MKVKIKYTEVQYFKSEKEVDMTKKEYNRYLKTGKTSKYREHEMSDITGDGNHVCTDTFNITFEKI